jgi:hypothetical protein
MSLLLEVISTEERGPISSVEAQLCMERADYAIDDLSFVNQQKSVREDEPGFLPKLNERIGLLSTTGQ